MKSEIIYSGWTIDGKKRKKTNLVASGTVIKETAKQIVLKQNDNSTITINKSKIVKEFDIL